MFANWSQDVFSFFVWHGDGTFHCASKYFMQLNIIHCWIEHRMIPAVFALMKRRRLKDYVKLLEVLKFEALNIGLNLKPQQIGIMLLKINLLKLLLKVVYSILDNCCTKT